MGVRRLSLIVAIVLMGLVLPARAEAPVRSLTCVFKGPLHFEVVNLNTLEDPQWFLVFRGTIPGTCASIGTSTPGVAAATDEIYGTVDFQSNFTPSPVNLNACSGGEMGIATTVRRAPNADPQPVDFNSVVDYPGLNGETLVVVGGQTGAGLFQHHIFGACVGLSPSSGDEKVALSFTVAY